MMTKSVEGMPMSTNSWAIEPVGPISEFLSTLRLVDHHVHGVVRDNPSLESFTNMITESDRTPSSLDEALNTQVGFALRRWCAPILDLPLSCGPREYFNRRIELGSEEVNQRFLTSSGIDHYFIETGYRGDEIHDPAGMARLSGAKVDQIIRLETIAEKVALSGVSADNFSRAYSEQLRREAKTAVGLKSIVAYRIGLDFDPTPPSRLEVESAAGEWLAEVERTGKSRLHSPVLLRHLLWQGVELVMPFQFHIGYGDPDLDLHRCDPLLLGDFIRALETKKIPVLLLHTYPFQRNAGYLAQMFRNVYLDVGLAVNYTGARSSAIIAESLELAPFHKILFSSDAWGLSELTYLGSLLFKRGLGEVLDNFVSRGDWSSGDAISVAQAIGRDNALRIYGFPKESFKSGD
jgi:predicted TIM-barrel fold metal-dependent hydrolase